MHLREHTPAPHEGRGCDDGSRALRLTELTSIICSDDGEAHHTPVGSPLLNPAALFSYRPTPSLRLDATPCTASDWGSGTLETLEMQPMN